MGQMCLTLPHIIPRSHAKWNVVKSVQSSSQKMLLIVSFVHPEAIQILKQKHVEDALPTSLLLYSVCSKLFHQKRFT